MSPLHILNSFSVGKGESFQPSLVKPKNAFKLINGEIPFKELFWDWQISGVVSISNPSTRFCLPRFSSCFLLRLGGQNAQRLIGEALSALHYNCSTPLKSLEEGFQCKCLGRAVHVWHHHLLKSCDAVTWTRKGCFLLTLCCSWLSGCFLLAQVMNHDECWKAERGAEIQTCLFCLERFI